VITIPCIFPNVIFWKLNLFPYPSEKMEREKKEESYPVGPIRQSPPFGPSEIRYLPTYLSIFSPEYENKSLKKQTMNKVRTISYID
jgi:hypothetical protein